MTASSLATGALLFSGFVVGLFILSKVLPGRVHQGVPLRDGTRITYKLNGLLIHLLVWAAIGVATAVSPFSLEIVHTHFWELFVVANVFAFAMTGGLYLLGRRSAEGFWKGLFYGAELNPSWFGVDLKMFSYRPSLIGLSVINASFAYAQFAKYGQLYPPMVLFQVFTFLYLTNYFQFEHGMLHTWDIIAERFGWMLLWGDYVLVPFFYSLAGWTLVDRTVQLPWPAVAALCLLFIVGYTLFRGSNGQKHRSKVDPDARIWGKPVERLEGKLLVSGFWGIGRKLNYTGEIMVYFSFTLTCGVESFVPYLLPLWLTSLLVHRAWRDEQRCRAKYGELWSAYCRRAKFRMVPFIY